MNKEACERNGGRNGDGTAGTGREWYVATVETGCEGRVASVLHRFTIGVWFPKCRLSRSTRARRWTELLPLLPGYLFVTFAGAPRWRLMLETPRVGGVLGRDGEPRAVRVGDVERFQRALAVHGGALPVNAPRQAPKMKAGDRVRITEGPFTDFPAQCLVVSDDEITLELDLFGRAVPLTVPEAQVVPA